VALVGGEAGIGKSLLVKELRGRVPDGVVVLAGQADPGGLSHPFALLLDALSDHVAADDHRIEALRPSGDEHEPLADRYVLARYAAAATQAREAYDAFDFQAIVHTLTHLATVDISAFYSNVSKDCVYTLRPTSAARRSAQTAMYVMADGICRLLAPILPITADELWRVLPGQREKSVHLALLPAGVDTYRDDALIERWTKLIAVRDVVNGALEAQRQAKTIGTSLEARVIVSARGETLDLLRASAGQLDMLFIVSGTEVRDAGADGPELAVEVVRSDGTKCIRCWRYVHDITTEPAFAGLCGRCVANLFGNGEDRHFA
jgi:isoleucyl-tRNA synthetase